MNHSKEINNLFSNFDRTFLELYLSFVESINIQLIDDEQYIIKNKKEILFINIELRILDLLKLGITDNKNISSFLSITLQIIL